MIQFQSAKTMRRFYERLSNERHFNQSDKVNVSISRAQNQLLLLSKGLNEVIPENAGFNQVYQQMINKSKGRLDELLEKQGTIQLAFFGHKDKEAIIHEVLDLDFFTDFPCLEKKYQFKGLISGQLQIQLDDLPLIFSEDFKEYIENETIKIEAHKAVLLDQLIALQDAYQDEPSFLNKVQVDYDTRVADLEMQCKALKHFINHELLAGYTFHSILEYEVPLELVSRFDGLVYVMDHNQLYYQKEEEIIKALKIKKSIGVLLTEEEPSDKLKREVQNRYDQVFTEVMIVNRETFDKHEFVDLIDKIFDADYEALKHKSKVIGFESCIKTFKNDSKEMTKSLINAYNQLAVLKNEISSSVEKEHTALNSKVVWLLNNYEMRIKFSIEEKIKEYVAMGNTESIRTTLLDEAFLYKDFKEELYNLKRNLIKMTNRFYEKHRIDFEEDFNYFDLAGEDQKNYVESISIRDYELLSKGEIESLVKALTDKSLRMPFGKKKKLIQIQELFLKVLDEATERLKKEFYDEIQATIKKMNIEIYDGLQEEFDTNHVEAKYVNQTVRYIDDSIKQLSTESVDFSIKDMLRHSTKQ